MSYKVAPLEPEYLEQKREHARRRPYGRTAELIGHIDWLEEQLKQQQQPKTEGFQVGKRVKLLNGAAVSGAPQPGDKGVITEIADGAARVVFDDFPELGWLAYEFDRLELI